MGRICIFKEINGKAKRIKYVCCIYETEKYYYGYIVSKEISDYSLTIKMDNTKDWYYINCDALYQIDRNNLKQEEHKTIYYLPAINNKIKQLESAKKKIHLRADKSCIKWGKQNKDGKERKELHEELHYWKHKNQEAIFNNDKEMVKQSQKKVEEIMAKLGYSIIYNGDRVDKNFIKITNPKPYMGGSFTPK